jgi:hypothetical protein
MYVSPIEQPKGGTSMHRHTNSTLLLSAAILLMAMAPSANAASCSLANAAGKWGFSYSGTALTPSGPVPLASSGYYSEDASGNMSGAETVNLGGNAAQETIAGKFTAGANCQWTLVANVYQGGTLVRTSVIDGVWVLNSTQATASFRSVTLPDNSSLPVVITINASRMFPPDQD